MISDLRNLKLACLLTSTAMMSVPAAIAQDAQDTQPVDEVVTTGVFIPNEKRITSEITSVLDEEIFETIGAGDIADALTRVTGLSISRGKFVIVRGLNERYSFATLNGSPLPSPEPLRRVAPLDLFPTSILSDVVVQKTFTPEFSGEFGGGAINMSTKALPDEKFLELSFSTSLNTETGLRNGLVYEGSGTDFLGFDDGLRDLPALDANGVPTENFDNFDTLVIDLADNIPVNFGGRITGGNRYDLANGQSIGVLATVGYDNSWETRRGLDNTAQVSLGELVEEQTATRFSTENKISLNGLLSAGVEFDENNTVEAVLFASRQSSAEARTQEGLFDQRNNILRRDSTEWFEREVYMGQVFGEHIFPSFNDAVFTWRASYAIAGRDAPYERSVTYEDFEDGNGFRFRFNRPGSTTNSIQFSTLDDDTLDFGADVVLPLNLNSVLSAELKFGGSYLDKSRDTQQSDFFYFITFPRDDGGLRFSRIDQIFSDAVFNSSIGEIRRLASSSFPDIAQAGLEVGGAYTGIDVEFTEFLRLAAGFRFESSEQTTAVDFATIPDSAFAFDPLDEDFFLPSATLTYTFSDFQLRLGASKTINRPQFRELTPTRFVNTETDDTFVGNAFLQNSESINLDARLEYYFGAAQFFTVGAFYKDFTNPIEEFILDSNGDNITTSFLNAPSAELFGIEAEFERKFEMGSMADSLGVSGGWDSRDFVVRTNYTFTDSSVAAGPDLLNITVPVANPSAGILPTQIAADGLYTDGRRLQGQSDHIANIQLGIEDYNQNWEATLLFNYASERIRSVEQRSTSLPSIFEQLPVTLDFVFNKDFELRGGEYEFSFRVQNILGDGYEAFQELGDSRVLIDTYDIGTTFGASLKRRF